MNLRNASNYNIGLDIGTGSVGWAVTDEDGNLFHFKGKPTWGSRLFPSAQTAADARSHRAQRRRYDRRRQRLDLLQGFFLEEMEKTDPEFFIRLHQSKLLKEDRAEGHDEYLWPLFNDSDFNEKSYYNHFPTIYHLRKWLMETDEQADIRLIYLAFHNIVKTRGNFLHQDNLGLSAKNASVGESVDRLCSALADWCEEAGRACSCNSDKMIEILEQQGESRAQKREALVPLFGFGAEGKLQAKEIASAILGYKANFAKVFNIEGEGLRFDLGNDESVDAFLGICPDEAIEVFESIQLVNSSYVLSGILKGGSGQTISYCKVAEYDQYGRDLALLKGLVREYAPGKYNEFFRGEHYPKPWQKDYDPAKAKGYTRYNLGVSKLDYGGFKKETLKLFADTEAVNDSRYDQMEAAFNEDAFLRRLKTSDNGSIPYQLHLEEMEAIIENQSAYYPFLTERKRELTSLVTFRIPYYVGPLTIKNARKDASGNNRFAWSVRKPGKENAAVKPWNWEEIIDKDKSAESFIMRMTGTCTYLRGEPVLPKCSLLYEKYCVLNELNGATWSQDGDIWWRFDYADRRDIFKQLFKKRKSVSYKAVEDWLKRHNRTHPHVRGGQGEHHFESKLASHVYFCDLLGVDNLSDSQIAMVEEIILWNTLFEDRDILKNKIAKKYGDKLDSDQIRKVCKKRFAGWGRLSKAFLCELHAETPDGKKSIMDLLEDGSTESGRIGRAVVLMEILHDDNLGFETLVDKFNKKMLGENGEMQVNELPGSPALRRSVNQAMRIVAEIVSIAGNPPANVFIEVTRDDDERKKGRRTTRRYDGLKEALESLKAEGAASVEILQELKQTDPQKLDERLMLYFMQNGKSLYSGKPLDIRLVVSGDQSYQVDHIIPRSYIKDDSFENKALVYSDENQRKTDELLIDPAIRKKMAPMWRELRDAKLISEKKFKNLMRSDIKPNQMKGFINRQLVETSQIAKFVRMMLESRYPGTQVRSIKAGLSSQLREAQDFVKCREANDYHHAHDAYLACEVGRFIQFRHAEIFDNPIAVTHVMRQFVRAQSEQYKATHRMPGSASFVIGSFLTSGFDKETGEVFKDTWDADAEVAKIRRCLNFRHCYISRMPEVTSGTFWDATVYSPKGSNKKLSLPLKKALDPSKYGSFSREQFAYFFVYKAKKKGKLTFDFAPVPVSVAFRIEKDPSALDEYASLLADAKGFEFVRIERSKVYKYQLIEVEGERLYITGIKEVRNATQLAFSQDEMKVLAGVAHEETLDSSVAYALFKLLVSKFELYAPKLAHQIDVADLEDGFAEAGLVEQGKSILSLVNIANAATNMIDLTAVGSVKCAGCMSPSISKMLSSKQGVVFIDQSVTGMFERRQHIGF